MELQEKIKEFKDQQKKMRAYDHALNLLTYDAATDMPRGGSETLGDTLAVLSEASYRLTVNDEYKKVLADLKSHLEELDSITRREVEVLSEEQEKTEKVPAEEVVATQVAENAGQHYWEIAKKTNDFDLFKPHLAKLIDIKKRYAKYVNPDEENIYNTLMDDFEKYMTVEDMEPFFNNIKEKLVPLIEKIKKSGNRPRTDFLEQKFDIGKQKQLSEYVMDVMKIDKNRCMLKETEHPFTTEFSKNDVRITTHYSEDEMTSNLFSVIHESGHAMYELSVGDELIHSALGHGSTTAIHESQSRLWENYIGRSLPFVKLIFPKIKELFPDQMKDVTAEDFYGAINVAEPSLIRTEADELTYSLHVLIRYEIEKKIFKDEITVDQLPEEWNRLYKEYLGIDVPDDTHGVLQDAHWAGGAFGYFPSYALGTAYSAQIMEALKKDIDVKECCEKGDLSPVKQWLTDKIYKHGMVLTAKQIIEETCHEPFNPDYYTDYLIKKYTKIYDL